MSDDDLTWDKTGKKVTATDIAATSQKLGLKLPDDYAKFLESTNGGVPSRRKFATSAGNQTITHFYSLGDLRIELMQFRGELELPMNFVPIALAETNIVLLNDGKVQLWYMIESGFRQDHVCDVADSFDAFLSQLQKKIAKAK